MAKRVSVDRWLFTVTMLLVFLGLVMVFSRLGRDGARAFGSPYAFLSKQLIWAVAGLVAMVDHHAAWTTGATSIPRWCSRSWA